MKAIFTAGGVGNSVLQTDQASAHLIMFNGVRQMNLPASVVQ